MKKAQSLATGKSRGSIGTKKKQSVWDKIYEMMAEQALKKMEEDSDRAFIERAEARELLG